MLLPTFLSLSLVASLVRADIPTKASVILASGAELQPRLEIRELEKDVDQWNLFLLGFKSLKEVNSTDHLSYYRIAGIHGYPFSTYDGVERCHDCFDDIGYCPHASTLFMTWHRPHLALFEQTLRTHVFKIVEEYPAGEQRERYKIAAQKLRLPYWDWAKAQPAGQDILPQSVVKPTVELAGPKGKETVENPLLRYTFGSVRGPPGGEDYPLPNDTTVRHFDIPPAAPVSHHDMAVLAVHDTVTNHSGPDLRCNLYRLMANSSNLNYLSTKLWDERRNTTSYDNMEAIHDAIHRAIGGDYNDGLGVGTMYWTPAAAFDPIFWMHHAMVDRMFAMWQVLYPDNWLKPADGTETWTLFENNTVDGSTALTPFHSDTSGKFWTSDTLRDHTVLGYTYPEFFNKIPTQADIKAVINNLYSTDCMVGPTQATQPKEPQPKDPTLPNPIPNLPQPTPKGVGPSAEPKNTGPKGVLPRQSFPEVPEAGASGTNANAIALSIAPLSPLPKPSSSPAPSAILKSLKFTGPRPASLPWLSNDRSGWSYFPKLSLLSPPTKRISQAPARSLSKLSSQIPGLTNTDGHLREYVANIHVSPQSFGGSFKLFLYDGDSADEANLLGYKFFMVPERLSGKARKSGRKARRRDVVGSVTLTSSLMSRVSRGTLGGMSNADVGNYLRNRIVWKAVKMDGTIVPPQNITALGISIITSDVEPARSQSELPTWGNTRVLLGNIARSAS